MASSLGGEVFSAHIEVVAFAGAWWQRLRLHFDVMADAVGFAA
jgi:hypothetical protein